jgi:hypothetical protein
MEKLAHSLFVVVIIAMLVALAGCASAAAPATDAVHPAATATLPVAQQITPTSLAGDASLPALAEGALFRVIKPDGNVVMFTVDDLKALPLAQYMTEGKVEEGPKLLDVLAKAGITDFTEVVISGPKSSQTLVRAQVDDQAVLDFNNHGTVKFSGPALAKVDWVKDVDLIVVR